MRTGIYFFLLAGLLSFSACEKPERTVVVPEQPDPRCPRCSVKARFLLTHSANNSRAEVRLMPDLKNSVYAGTVFLGQDSLNPRHPDRDFYEEYYQGPMPALTFSLSGNSKLPACTYDFSNDIASVEFEVPDTVYAGLSTSITYTLSNANTESYLMIDIFGHFSRSYILKNGVNIITMEAGTFNQFLSFGKMNLCASGDNLIYKSVHFLFTFIIGL